MFNAFINTTTTLQSDCVTIKLFGLTTRLLITDIEMFIFGLVVTIILADMLADYMLFNIEEAKKKKEETGALLKELKNLQEEIKDLKTLKCLKKVPSGMIIQCDKCYNEYNEHEIKTRKIIGHIFQQYCINCYYLQNIRKSQSDTKLNYQ